MVVYGKFSKMKNFWLHMPTTRGRQGSKVAHNLLFSKARDEKQHSSFTLLRIWIMVISTQGKNVSKPEMHELSSKCVSMDWDQMLELLFIHNLNIPYSISSCQWSSKGWTTKLDSLDPNIFGSQYHAFKTFKCLAKLFLHWGCNQYCGYTMLMVSNKAQWEKWLSHSLINWAIASINQY